MDEESRRTTRRPAWAWLALGGGLTLATLIALGVAALSLKPLPMPALDPPVQAAAPVEGPLAVAPPRLPGVPPVAEPLPPTVTPPPAPDPHPAPPIRPPPPAPPTDLEDARRAVPGPSQARRFPLPPTLRPAPFPSPPSRGGRDG